MTAIDWLLDADPAIRWQVRPEALAVGRVSGRLVLHAPARARLLPRRTARPGPDERMAEALDIIESKRDANGRWPLDHAYHDASLVDFGEAEGKPSRWITLRALRVLRWAGRAPLAGSGLA